MKRPSPRWIAAPLAACLALALGGCGVLGKKEPAAPEAASEAADAAPGTDPQKLTKDQKEAQPDASAPAESSESKKTDTASGEPAKKDAPAEPTADPLAAEEFKGLPKGEAEFILACRTLAAGGKSTMTGRDGYVFDTRELAGLGANSTTATPRHQAMVAAIKAQADRLRAAGIELVLAPVPTKPVVYPDFLGTEPALKDRRYDSYLQALYAELQKAGVRVEDVTKPLRSDRTDKNAASFPKTGLLWSPAAASTAARAIHAATRKTDAAKAIPRDKTIVARDTALTQNGETFKARSVGWAQGDRLVPATVAKEGAAIVVIGDDHAAAHRTEGVNASLADQMSLAFGSAVDTRTAANLGWKEAAEFTPAQDSPTKLVVWCFSSHQFLDAPAVAEKKPTRPRKTSRSADRGDDLPSPGNVPSLDGPGLRLRDDPGLEARPE